MVEMAWFNIALLFVSAFMLGVAIRGTFALRTQKRVLDDLVTLQAHVMILRETCETAVEMMDEEEVDELTERVEEKLMEKYDQWEALHEIDPLGAAQL